MLQIGGALTLVGATLISTKATAMMVALGGLIAVLAGSAMEASKPAKPTDPT